MASDTRRRERRKGEAGARRRVAWSLSGEKLARRVPRFAEFVDAPEAGDTELTSEQREFLGKFSVGMSEAMSEERGATEEKAGGDATRAN